MTDAPVEAEEGEQVWEQLHVGPPDTDDALTPGVGEDTTTWAGAEAWGALTGLFACWQPATHNRATATALQRTPLKLLFMSFSFSDFDKLAPWRARGPEGARGE